MARFTSNPLAWLGGRLVDLLYPPLCPGCEHVLLEEDATGLRPTLCPACEGRLAPLVEPFCHVCGQGYASGGEIPVFCSNCGGRKFAFEFAIAPFHAKGMLRELVHRFKFAKAAALRRPLGTLMTRVFDDPRLTGHDWVLVPVPIHRPRQRQRTFNQSAELAAVLAEHTGYPVVPALRRAVYTPPQSRLNRQQRLENLNHAIVAAPRAIPAIHDRDILLVDDIFTTGSTGHACAGVLKSHGARKVVVITLARG